MSKADAKRSATEARKLISLMMSETSTMEVEELANEIVALVISASESRREALDAEAERVYDLEMRRHNFTELLPELLGEKAGIVSIPDSFWKPYDDYKQEQA